MTFKTTVFTGCWSIDWMSSWSKGTIDMEGPAFILFHGTGGRFRFICVNGDTQRTFTEKQGRPHVEFTWDGNDEMDEANGRGWATVQKDGSIKGRIYIHQGDHGDFTATKSDLDLSGPHAPAPKKLGSR